MAEDKVEKSNVLMLIQKAMLSRTYNPPQIFDFYMTAESSLNQYNNALISYFL